MKCTRRGGRGRESRGRAVLSIRLRLWRCILSPTTPPPFPVCPYYSRFSVFRAFALVTFWFFTIDPPQPHLLSSISRATTSINLPLLLLSIQYLEARNRKLMLQSSLRSKVLSGIRVAAYYVKCCVNGLIGSVGRRRLDVFVPCLFKLVLSSELDVK